jgi:hypothetical protein
MAILYTAGMQQTTGSHNKVLRSEEKYMLMLKSVVFSALL